MARKIKATTQNDGWAEPKKKKVRKKRKPMTEEQRQAAAKRLEKVRQKRAEKNPDYGVSGVHHSIQNVPDDYPISAKNVKQWIKTQKELAREERKLERQGIKGSTSKRAAAEGYIRQMKHYLKHGDWISPFYGEYEQHLVKYNCVALAYDKDGMPKRNVGTYYPDMGCRYTQEMCNEDRNIENANVQKAKGKRRKRSKGAVA